MISLAISTAFDIAAITASEEAASANIENAVDQQPGIVWRSTSTTPYVVVDLGAAVSVNRIGLLFCNLTAAATMRIRAASTEAGLTAIPSYDQTVTAWVSSFDHGGDKHALHRIAAPVAARWWRVDFSDAGNPEGYVEGGRVWVGYAYEPSRQPNWNVTESFNDVTGLPEYSCTLDWIAEAEWSSSIKPLIAKYGWGTVTTNDDGVMILRDPSKLVLCEQTTITDQYSMGNIIYGTMRSRDASLRSLGRHSVRLQFTGMKP